MVCFSKATAESGRHKLNAFKILREKKIIPISNPEFCTQSGMSQV